MKDIRINYFMDPICSYCWALSGVLRRLKLEYGDEFSMETYMGGLMPPGGFDTNSEDYMSNQDIAHLWDEANKNLNVPINGNVWIDSPLDSSYVAGIAYKSAAFQSVDKADKYLRLLQEKLFVESINISDAETVYNIAKELDLDIKQLQQDCLDRGRAAFEKDIALLLKLEVQLFPTLFFYNSNGLYKMVDKLHPYQAYEAALLELKPDVVKQQYERDTLSLLNYFGSMTINDIVILLDISNNEAEKELNHLVDIGSATRIDSKGGSLWRV